MNSFLRMVTLSLLCATAITCPLEAGRNKVFNPKEIFEERDGEKITRSPIAIGANILHKEGIEGQLKNKKRLLVAIIGINFFPGYTELLAKEQMGLLHPSAVKENLIFTSKDLESVTEEELDKQMMEKCGSEIAKLEAEAEEISNDTSLTDSQRDSKLEGVNQRSQEFLNNKLLPLMFQNVWAEEVFKGGNAFGSGLMEVVHLVAPKAQLLPIDMWAMDREMLINSYRPNSRISLSKAFATVAEKSIDKAIALGADVIYLDGVFDTAQFAAMKRASQKGIPIFMPAGNASSKNNPASFDKDFEASMGDETGEKVEFKNLKQQAIHALKGEGIQIVGAVKYSKTAGLKKTIGEEKPTEYTQYPTASTKQNFLFAAGHEIPVHSRIKREEVKTEDEPEKIASGSELAAAAAAAACALLKQFVLENNYKISPNDLLKLMYDTARDVEVSYGTMAGVYKSLDLANAKKKLEAMMRPTSVSKESAKPAEKVVTPAMRSLPTKPTVAPASEAKPAPQFGANPAPAMVNTPGAAPAPAKRTWSRPAAQPEAKPASQFDVKVESAKPAATPVNQPGAAPAPAKRTWSRPAAQSEAKPVATPVKPAPKFDVKVEPAKPAATPVSQPTATRSLPTKPIVAPASSVKVEAKPAPKFDVKLEPVKPAEKVATPATRSLPTVPTPNAAPAVKVEEKPAPQFGVKVAPATVNTPVEAPAPVKKTWSRPTAQSEAKPVVQPDVKVEPAKPAPVKKVWSRPQPEVKPVATPAKPAPKFDVKVEPAKPAEKVVTPAPRSLPAKPDVAPASVKVEAKPAPKFGVKVMAQPVKPEAKPLNSQAKTPPHVKK